MNFFRSLLSARISQISASSKLPVTKAIRLPSGGCRDLHRPGVRFSRSVSSGAGCFGDASIAADGAAALSAADQLQSGRAAVLKVRAVGHYGRAPDGEAWREPERPSIPPPPPSPLAFNEPDCVYVPEGMFKGLRSEFLRDGDGRVAWYRAGGRVHRRVR